MKFLYLIPLLPLLGFLFNFTVGVRVLGRPKGGHGHGHDDHGHGGGHGDHGHAPSPIIALTPGVCRSARPARCSRPGCASS